MEFKSPNGITTRYEIVDGISVVSNESILSEKYRPCEVSDLILPTKMKATVEKWIEEQEIPNFILHSSQGGSGKDSIINVLASKLEDHEFISINTSLYRNVSDLKDKLLQLVGRVGAFGQRVIYLSETGGMNKIATDSLKALIEENSHINFIMSSNDLSNLSEPLQTRFNKYDMSAIPQDERKTLIVETIKRVLRILSIEGIDATTEDVKLYVLERFPSHRNIILDLSMYIMDNKFEYDSVKDNELFTKFIKAIAEDDASTMVKITQLIDPLDFMRWFNVNKLVITPSASIATTIFAMNALQQDITNNVPFKDVALANFAFELHGIKFKIKD